MACPEPLVLSRFCDADLEGKEARTVELHLARCPRCRGQVDEERRLSGAFGALACPDPETLAQFVDETLEPAAVLERVAGHVLRCEPCTEIVTWTREAAAATSEKRTSGRRRRRAGTARHASPWLAIGGAGAAAAAALLLFVALRGGSTAPTQIADPGRTEPPKTDPQKPDPQKPDPQKPGAQKPGAQKTDPRTKPAQDPDGQKTDPRPTGQPDAQSPDAPKPDAPVDPEPRPIPQPDTPQPDPQPPVTPQPDTTPRDPRPDPTAREDGPLVAALDEGFVVRQGDGREAALIGATRLPAGATIRSPRDGAALQVGRTTCLLTGEVSAAPDGTAALVLASGKLFVDAPDAGLELRAGEAAVRATKGGARFAFERESGGAVMLCVVSGEARASHGVDALLVAAGSAARSERSAWKQEKRAEPSLQRAREQALRAELAASIAAPRGLLALRALRSAEPALDPARTALERARAAQSVFALRAADQRLSRLAARHVPAAEAALRDLLAIDPAALAKDRAAAPTLLAAVHRFRALHPGKSTIPDAEREPITRLAESIAALAPDTLALDPDALLALRAAERLARFRIPRAALEGAQPAAPLSALLHTLLAKKKDAALAARVLAETDAALNETPWTRTIPPADLLAFARALALTGDDTPERTRRVLAHAWAGKQDDAPFASIVANETRAIHGQPAPDEVAASVMVVPAAEGWRVTFLHRPGKRLRSLHLVASWDGWKPEGIAMEQRPDGSWAVTQTLPAGRHEYKLIVDRGDWIIDPVNPLTGPSNVNATENSVLLLD